MQQMDESCFQQKTLSAKFKKITRSYVIFHCFFGILAFAELCSFIFFFSFWIHSSAVAFLIGAILFTGFSYFVLHSYFQTRKPLQLIELGQSFVHLCRSSTPDGVIHAIYRVLDDLDYMEAEYYAIPPLGETTNLLLKKFSIYCHWRDVLVLKEQLLYEAITEHIALVKKAPTDLGIHAALADAYLKLAKLYKEPKKPLPWIPPEYSSQAMQSRYRATCERVLQEFNIIEAYVPQDPWIHAQLANIYHELGHVEKEITEYEAILLISPQDKTIMYHLGVLYFKQGNTAKGLQMYEKLHKLQDEKASQLIANYSCSLDLLQGLMVTK